MRFTLKDYQTDAVQGIITHLQDARDDVRRKGRRIAFALSATTGAGKTVMATAVIEALFRGSEEYDVEADPSAVVLWVTDDPSLNEQTRYRMIESGDRLAVSQLRIIGDGGFDQEKFEAGNVYFLNVQKLGSATTYVKKTDERTYTLWDTIQNTIEDDRLTLYLVLDEAHRGMRSGDKKRTDDKNRSTIVQRLINGHNGVPPVPIVWGISATVQRFTDAMTAAHSEGRIVYPPIEVDPRVVQESGLLKDKIILDIPDEAGNFETTLLRSAAHDARTSTQLWADYAARENLPDAVVPLLVLQVPNTPKDADLIRFLDGVYDEWPELGAESVAHVFGDHADKTLGKYNVPYIAPQHVQDARHVRVLLAKDAISTGWDCPRAEVIVSFRPANDRTYITQLIGRMVRTPLARRVHSDERLNAVACFLPHFNHQHAKAVVQVLTGELADAGDPDSAAGKGSGRKVLTNPVTMLWNDRIPDEVKALFALLPSEVTPKGTVKPIKRLLALAAAIASDRLIDNPNEQAYDALCRVLDGQMAQRLYDVDKNVRDIEIAEIRRYTGSIGEDGVEETTMVAPADDLVIAEAYRGATRAIGAAMANRYTKRLALPEDQEQDEFDVHDAKLRVAALLMIPEVRIAVESEAERLAEQWLNALRVKIKGLSDDRTAVYDDLRRQAREPQIIDIVVPVSRIENTRDDSDNLLPTKERHLLADENGNFPVESLNDWERTILHTELARPETIAWYRNPSAATADALQVPYRLGDAWKTMQPDFIFFTKNQTGSVSASIVDPHGHHLADALPKLQGLARFAERYGDRFSRVEAVAKIDDELMMLDMQRASVRDSVEKAVSASELYRSGQAEKY